MMFSKKKLMRDLAITNYMMQKYDISFTISLEEISSDINADYSLYEDLEEEF